MVLYKSQIIVYELSFCKLLAELIFKNLSPSKGFCSFVILETYTSSIGRLF